jgi:hypothetical protein
MNHYGHLAERYWIDYLPSRVDALDDPDRFFTEMGLQVQTEVDTIYTAMTKVVPADVAPEKVEGWKNMARKMAEEKVLAEIVYLEPDPSEDEDWLPEEPGWRDLWPDTIITDVIQETYDAETGPLS